MGTARGEVLIDADLGDDVLLGIARGDEPVCGEAPGIWREGRRALGNVSAWPGDVIGCDSSLSRRDQKGAVFAVQL